MEDFTTATYDRIVQRYVDHRVASDIWVKEREEFSSLLKGNRILDAGCGPGIETAAFVADGFRVLGIDKSKGMLEEAKKRVPEAEFRQMDMLNIKLEPNFNGVWCCASLLHLRKMEAGKALLNFKAVLEKDGIIFISVKEGEGETIEKYPDGTKRFFAYYNEKELAGLIKESGLELIKSYKNLSDPDKHVWLSFFCRKA